MGNIPSYHTTFLFSNDFPDMDKFIYYRIEEGENPALITYNNMYSARTQNLIIFINIPEELAKLRIEEISDTEFEIQYGGRMAVIRAHFVVVMFNNFNPDFANNESINHEFHNLLTSTFGELRMQQTMGGIHETVYGPAYMNNAPVIIDQIWQYDRIKRSFYSPLLNIINNNFNSIPIYTNNNKPKIQQMDPEENQKPTPTENTEQRKIQSVDVFGTVVELRPKYFDLLYLEILGMSAYRYMEAYDNFISKSIMTIAELRQLTNDLGGYENMVRFTNTGEPYINIRNQRIDSLRNKGVNIIMYNYLTGMFTFDMDTSIASRNMSSILMDIQISDAITNALFGRYSPRVLRPFASSFTIVERQLKGNMSIKIYQIVVDTTNSTITLKRVSKNDGGFASGGTYIVVYFPILKYSAMQKLREAMDVYGTGNEMIIDIIRPSSNIILNVNQIVPTEEAIELVNTQAKLEQVEEELRQIGEGNNINTNWFEDTEEDVEALQEYQLEIGSQITMEEVKGEQMEEEYVYDESQLVSYLDMEIAEELGQVLQSWEKQLLALMALPQMVKDNIPYFGQPIGVSPQQFSEFSNYVASLPTTLAENLPTVPNFVTNPFASNVPEIPQFATNALSSVVNSNSAFEERFINAPVRYVLENVPYANTAFWHVVSGFNSINDRYGIIKQLIPILISTGIYVILPKYKDEIIRATSDYASEVIESVINRDILIEDLLKGYDNRLKSIAKVAGLVTLPVEALVNFPGSDIAVFNINKGLSYMMDNNKFLDDGSLNQEYNPFRFSRGPGDDDYGDDDYDDFGGKKSNLPKPYLPKDNKPTDKVTENNDKQSMSVNEKLGILSSLTGTAISALGLVVNTAVALGKGAYWLIAGAIGLAAYFFMKK